MDWTTHWTKSLPIDARIGEVLEALAAAQVVVCEASTGSGKTTRLAQAAVIADPNLRVWVTQPRRAAVRWIATHIAKEMGVQLGTLVGYSLRRDDSGVATKSSETRLEFLVDKSLINRIRSRGMLPGLIVVDEAHERSIDIDLLLGLLKDALQKSPETKLLITSATIDTDKFAQYFGPATRTVRAAVDTPHPVMVRYQRDHIGEKTTEEAEVVTARLIDDFFAGRLVVADGSIAVNKGTVIVLLPGRAEISSVLSGLELRIRARPRAGPDPGSIELRSCTGSSTVEELDQVQAPTPEGTLRIVCGTEVLRSSVTVPDAIAVVDSLLVKRMISNEQGISHLKLISVSHTEAMQGKGRVGRTGPGVYFPMCSEAELRALEPHPQPAILRDPLPHTALVVAAMGESISEFDFIDWPNYLKAKAAIELLKRLGALESATVVTKLGLRLLDLPLDPEHARILLQAHELRVLAEAVVLVTMLETGSFLIKRRWKTELLELVQCDKQSDYAAIVRVYRLFKLEAKEKGISRPGKRSESGQLRKRCDELGIDLRGIRQAEDRMLLVMEEVAGSTVFASLGFDDIVKRREFDVDALSRAVLCGTPNGIATYWNAKGDDKLRYLGLMGEVTLNSDSLCNKLKPPAPFALVRNVREMPGRNNRSWALATFAAPILPVWISEELPHICDTHISDEHIDLEQLSAVATAAVHFNSKFLCEKVVPINDHDRGIRVLAQWMTRMATTQFRGDNLGQLPQVSIDVLEVNFACYELIRGTNAPLALNYVARNETEFTKYFQERLASTTLPVTVLLRNLSVARLPSADEAVATWRREEEERRARERRAQEEYARQQHAKELEIERLRIRRLELERERPQGCVIM